MPEFMSIGYTERERRDVCIGYGRRQHAEREEWL
jgi:hypothetical protein